MEQAAGGPECGGQPSKHGWQQHERAGWEVSRGELILMPARRHPRAAGAVRASSAGVGGGAGEERLMG